MNSAAPWQAVASETDGKHTQWEVRSADGDLVATVFYVTEKGRSDAQIMAAAPEMLQALQLVRMSVGWQHLSMESREVIQCALDRVEAGHG